MRRQVSTTAKACPPYGNIKFLKLVKHVWATVAFCAKVHCRAVSVIDVIFVADGELCAAAFVSTKETGPYTTLMLVNAR
jgi:hypothetical protein